MENVKKIVSEVSEEMGYYIPPQEVIQLPSNLDTGEAIFQAKFKILQIPDSQIDYLKKSVNDIDIGTDSSVSNIEIFRFDEGKWCMGLDIDTDRNLTSLEIPYKIRNCFKIDGIIIDEFHRYFTYIITFPKPAFTLKINKDHIEDINKTEVRKYLKYRIFIGLDRFFNTPLIPLEWTVY